MKIIKIIFIVAMSIMSFVGAFMGAAQARTYHFVGTIDGLMDSTEQAPFSEETTYTTNVSISEILDIAAFREQETINITLDTSNGTDLNIVDLSYELSNDSTL